MKLVMGIDINLTPIYHEMDRKVKRQYQKCKRSREEIQTYEKSSESILTRMSVSSEVSKVTLVLVFVFRLPTPIDDEMFQL